MSVVSKSYLKTRFERGDRPSQQDFTDLIDSYQNFVSTALASAGAFGVQIIATDTTAQAQSLLEAGAAGLPIFKAVTTVAVINLLGAGVVGAQLFNVATTAQAQSIIGTPSSFSGSISISGTSVQAASVILGEDTDNGVNTLSLFAPAAIASNRTVTFQDASGTIALTSGVAIIDRAYAEYATSTSITAVIPLDDTIPQVGEGTQILSATLTPKSTTNRIRVRFSCFVGYGASNISALASMFVNNAANAVQGTAQNSANNGPEQMTMEYEYVPGATSLQTITINVGTSNGGFGIYINSASSGRLFGGAAKATLILEEIFA